MLTVLAANLYRHRYLLSRLAYQQVTAQYRQSVFGLGWAVFQPVMYTLLFLALRGLVSIPSDEIPPALFTLTAMMAWSAFATGVTAGAASIVLNAALIRKIYFPRELFPAAAVLTRWIDFTVGLVLVLMLMGYYRTPLTVHLLWVLPLLALQTLLALALGLLTSALGAFKRDIVLGIPFLLQFGLILSPVIYPLSAVPAEYRPLYLLNPMAGIIESYRRALLLGLPPEAGPLFVSVVGTALACVFCYWVFKKLEMQFADVV